MFHYKRSLQTHVMTLILLELTHNHFNNFIIQLCPELLCDLLCDLFCDVLLQMYEDGREEDPKNCLMHMSVPTACTRFGCSSRPITVEPDDLRLANFHFSCPDGSEGGAGGHHP
ncbi:hypothetical protein LR48_Vigan11g139000 [Vigna angularis]|uniref:Uncharacterized protein n=1 Tax=Phaseolus angularis TaxID=3914 RepID=A0A0L9VTE4_PHAAN|nr:hypothetical protein LR48_Vigan11g139000 [Vigna angularis]